MTKTNKFTSEDGFSLIELVVAISIAIIIASVGVLTLPNLVTDSRTKTDAYEQCGLQRENEIMNIVNGDTNPTIAATCAPTATPAP